MFGLTIREQLIKAIQNASINTTPFYKAALFEIARCDDAFREEIAHRVSSEYHEQVLKSVESVMRSASSNAYARFLLVLSSPRLCGYEIDISKPLLAGSIYAMAYYALTNKPAKAKDCVALSHWQFNIMDNVLREVDAELSH